MALLAEISEQAQYSRKTAPEVLPCEIQVMILCQMPELSSLSSLVHAFPTYHQAFLGAREEILHAITIRTLLKNDIGLLDPWTAIHAPQLGHHIPHRAEIIGEYLDKYAQGRIDGSRRHLAPIDSLAILSLQRKFTALITNFCKDKFSKNPLNASSDDNPLPLSHSESHRLYRAFWRYEIYSKIFGPSKRASHRETHMYSVPHPYCTFSEVEIADKFFRLFPWNEVEELASLQKWARDYYFRDSFLDHGDQLVALGPRKLFEVMTAASDMERENRIAEDNRPRPNVTMRAALDAYNEKANWETWQSKGKYEKSNSELVPNTGWLWARNTGIQTTEFWRRRRGYEFWDSKRFDHWRMM